MVEEDHAGHLNAASEVQAVIEACLWMAKQKIPEFSIHFDYNGLEKWAKNEWKANSDLTRGYKDFFHFLTREDHLDQGKRTFGKSFQ